MLRRTLPAQALVEFAVVLPVLLLLVGGAIDFGRLFYTRVSIENAAKEGAFFGASHPRCDVSQSSCADPSNVKWHVENEALAANPVTTTVECIRAGSGVPLVNCAEDDSYRVTVEHRFLLVTPILSGLFGSGVDLTTSATARVLNPGFDPAATPAPTPTPTPTPVPTATPPGSCQVPNFSGTRANGADATWTAAGFSGAVTKLGAGNFTIVGQSLGGGGLQPCTSSITVSDAPVATPTPTPAPTPTGTATPTPTPTPACVLVPNVVGGTPTNADSAIRAAGLVPIGVGDLTTGQKNNVASQAPTAGTCVASGSSVTYHYRPN